MAAPLHAAMPGALARFQDGFARALRHADAAEPALAKLAAQPAFAVYRNTVLKGCIDALQSNFPAVARLVGDEWFRAAAAVYARGSPPVSCTLLDYGRDFADFLARFEPAAEMPYLPGVARLDRCWSEAHVAADAAALEAGVIAALSPAALAGTVLNVHPAARWVWFAGAPVYTIWSRTRAALALDEDLEWRSEGALLVRPRDAVAWIALDAAGCAFLDACARGGTLAHAAQAALAIEAGADLARLMSALLAAGAFSAQPAP